MSGATESKIAISHQVQPGLLPAISFRTIIVTSIGLAFVTGYISGAMFNSKFAADRMRHAVSNSESRVDEVFAQLDQQLAFSTEQKLQAAEILDRHFENSERIRRDNLPEILAEFDRFAIELHQVLNDQQQLSWNQQSQWIKRNCYGVEIHPPIN